jgi:CRP/FNR family cyclic AMP-dependent transcriptional regulator
MKTFDLKLFLSTPGTGREMLLFPKGQVIFAQGDASNAVFVIQTGRVRLSARTLEGREATLDILSSSDFVGKDSIAGRSIRTTSANAMTDCQLLRIEKRCMMLALRKELGLANLVCTYMLERTLRYQQDLVDQRCNKCKTRCARILLRLAQMETLEPRETAIPKIDQSILAEMVGTTRSRVSCFMNEFRQSGFIQYDQISQEVRVLPSLRDFYGG